MIKTYESHYVVSEQDIALFEQLVGYPLPADYAEFLLKFNGGIPSNGILNENMVIDYFFALKADYDEYQLSHQFQSWAEYMAPINAIPIATAPNGDYFILVEDRGIFYFEHDQAPDHLVPVAKSFSELLTMLNSDNYNL